MAERNFIRTVIAGQDVWRDVAEMPASAPYYIKQNSNKCLVLGNLYQDIRAWLRGKPAGTILGGGPPQTTTPISNALSRSRKRSAYTLTNTPITITGSQLAAGMYGSPNTEGWYEIKNLRIHSLTPGVPCVRVKDAEDYKVKLIDGVFDGLGVPGYGGGNLVFVEGGCSVWTHNCLNFSSSPPSGGNGVRCFHSRSLAAASPREIRVTNCESYGTAGYYVDNISRSTSKPFVGILISQTSCYNIRGSGFEANGSLRFRPDGRISITEYIGALVQFVQINNAINAPNIRIEYWTAHNDPDAYIGMEYGDVEDFWNIHTSSGTAESPLIISNYLVENGFPMDVNWNGTNTEHGRATSIGGVLGLPYSGSGGLNDGYPGTSNPGPNDVPHHVYAIDGTSLNTVNVGFGVTAGNNAKAIRVVSYIAGFFRSKAPGGYSRIIPRNGPEVSNKDGVSYGNNAVQGMQFYMAQGNKALFFGHQFEDLEASYNWRDDNGNWQQKSVYIDDPNGTQGSGPNTTYNSFQFKQNGVVLPPYNGGIKVHPKPTSPEQALAKLDELRAARVATFVAAGKVIGMTDRPLGDITNYWNTDI